MKKQLTDKNGVVIVGGEQCTDGLKWYTVVLIKNKPYATINGYVNLYPDDFERGVVWIDSSF